MTVREQFVEYKVDDTLFEGFLAFDSESHSPQPAILICHAWEGRNNFACDKARKLAQLGYTAFALDM